MEFIKKMIPALAIILCFASAILAQIDESGVSEELVTDQPSWIVNPIGSIIGLILLIAMFVGMAKAALSKQ